MRSDGNDSIWIAGLILLLWWLYNRSGIPKPPTANTMPIKVNNPIGPLSPGGGTFGGGGASGDW